MYSHRFPPLTRAELRELWERNPLPAVRRLLWEVYRLRAVALRAADLIRTLRHQGDDNRLAPMSQSMLKNVEEVLRQEAVVKEDEGRRL